MKLDGRILAQNFGKEKIECIFAAISLNHQTSCLSARFPTWPSHPSSHCNIWRLKEMRSHHKWQSSYFDTLANWKLFIWLCPSMIKQLKVNKIVGNSWQNFELFLNWNIFSETLNAFIETSRIRLSHLTLCFDNIGEVVMNAEEEITWNITHSENELLRQMEKIAQLSPALSNLEVIVRHGTRGLMQLMNGFKSTIRSRNWDLDFKFYVRISHSAH